MVEANEPEPKSTRRRLSRLGWGVAILLCLVCYVLSYPWVVYGLLHLHSPAVERISVVVTTLYYPVEHVCRLSETVDRCLELYLETLHETFPGYFDDSLLWRFEPGPP